jgi:predicted Zn-dependent protease
MGYSRDQERESDARGVEASYLAGYDPREGADVFRMFLAMKQEMGDDTPWFLSTHPADEERIANILAMCAEKDGRLAGTGEVAGFRRSTPEWTRLIARLREEQKTYDRYDRAIASLAQSKGGAEAVKAAIPALESCARELPGHALLLATLGKAKAVAGDVAGARADLTRAASMGQGLLEPEWILGLVAVEEERWDEAAAHADRGLAILPGNYHCLAVRGEARWNLGRRAEAESDFRQVLESAPEESDQYRLAASRIAGTEPARAPAKKRARR